MDELEDLIDRMPELALQAGALAMDETLLFLHEQIPPYPAGPAPQGQTVKNMTPRARRWFFANLRKGTPKLPYRRTGTLGRSFTTETRVQGTAVLGEIGTAVTYAPWVVGPAYPGREIRGRMMYQAKLHRGRWYDFEQVMAARGNDAGLVFEQGFRVHLGRLIEQQPGEKA